MNRALRITLVSFGVLVAATVIGGIGWFVHSQSPGEDARRLEALYRDRRRPPDADNAYMDVYGFAAPAGADPNTHGQARVRWLSRRNEAAETRREDPARDDLRFSATRTRLSERLSEACREGSPRACASVMAESVDAPRLNSRDDLLLSRYDRLLEKNQWFEALPMSDDIVLPAYGDLFEAQRIAFVRLYAMARRGDVEAIGAFLGRDLGFWRMVMRSSDCLITRMIAIAAIRYHFTYANLVLRELPPALVMKAVPPMWSAPLTDEERSMWRVMAGEYAFAISTLRPQQSGSGDDDPLSTKLVNKVLRRIGPNRMLNERAHLYSQLARDFEAPLSQYLRISQRVVAGSSQEDADQMAMYALRTGSVEGMRRAAVLVTQLRSRGVAPIDVEAELGRAELRRPFDDKPFRWIAADHAAVHEGPQARRPAIALYY